jgi:hypothetical protein
MDEEPTAPLNQLLTTKSATSSDVIRQQVTSQDYLVLRYAVVGLILAIVVSLMGVIALAFYDKTLPDGVIAIGSAAVGALATMLVRPPIDK